MFDDAPRIDRRSYRRWPEVLPEDKQAVLRVLDSGVLTSPAGEAVAGLEADFARFVGTPFCLATNSGTAALHQSLVAANVHRGDEVLVPAFTYGASAMSVAQQGAVPVFCDVDPGTYNLDPDKLAERFNDRTVAIMVVHLHGLPADMDPILDLARRHGLAVVEDFAQAQGARYKGRQVGTFGVAAGTSLNATKNLPGGEGGLFVTKDESAYIAARRLRYLGEDLVDADAPEGREYWSHGLGYNYRYQEMPAAFARSQLRRLEGYNRTARANAQRLGQQLEDVPHLLLPAEPEGLESVWYAYRVRLDVRGLGWHGEPRLLRDRVVRALLALGARVMLWQHHPLPAHPAFRRRLVPWTAELDHEPLRPFDPAEFPVAAAIADDSFHIGTGLNPLAIQGEELMDRYSAVLRWVMNNIEAITEEEWKPIARHDPNGDPTAIRPTAAV